MKICLIQPPIEDFYTTPLRNVPLGLLTIAAVLPEHQLQVLDLRSGRPERIPLPPELGAVAPYYPPDDVSPFGLYKHYYRFGPTPAAIGDLLPKDGDLFLISALFTAYAPTVYELIGILRKKAGSAWIVVGGAHATACPEDILQAGADFVVCGEGELAISALVTELSKPEPELADVPNLVWRKNGQIIRNPVVTIADLDHLPAPQYLLSGLPTYAIRGQRLAMLIASRGCPHRCTFCGINQVMGNRNRRHTVEYVLSVMDRMVARGVRFFDFEDDHFGGDREWLLELLDGIVARFGAGQLQLAAMNGITASNLDAVVLAKMRQAGFRALNLALVAPSRGQQQTLGRPFDTDFFIELVAQARALDFTVTTYLIIGLPGEPAAEILRAILLLSAQPVLLGPSLFYLVPGTALFAEIASAGRLPVSLLQYRATYFPVESAACSRTAAMTLFRLCRLVNFIKAGLDDGWPSVSYQLSDGQIFIPDEIQGNAVRRAVGMALLAHFFRTGQLGGARPSGRRRYRIVPEKVEPALLQAFLDEDWMISGVRSMRRCTKTEIMDRVISGSFGGATF